MANPARGEVDLVVGERTYTLTITTGALCAMEKRTGHTYGEILRGLMGVNVTATRDYLRAVLEPKHGRELTAAASKRGVDIETLVCDIIDTAGMRETKAVLVDLFTLNQPPTDEQSSVTKEGDETSRPPTAVTAGTGISSTLTAVASG